VCVVCVESTRRRYGASEDISTWEGWACDKWGTRGEHMGNNWRISATHSCLRFGLSHPEWACDKWGGGGQLGVRILASASDFPTQNRWLLLACPRSLALKLLERSTSCPNKETENRSLKSRQDNSCDKCAGENIRSSETWLLVKILFLYFP